MERIMIFMDFANVEAPSRRHGGMEYGHLLRYLSEGRFLVDGCCYVPVDPRRQMERARTIDALWEQGWNVRPKLGKIAGDSYKCNMDVDMTIDMMRTAHDIRPDIVVLCSGDEDFLPVVREIRGMGIRVEVAAFEDAMARRLRQQASGFISLDVYCREFAAGAGPEWPEAPGRMEEPEEDPGQESADLFADRSIQRPEAYDPDSPPARDRDREPHAAPEDRTQSASDGQLPDADRYR